MRNDYMPTLAGLPYKNDAPVDVILSASIQYYPDMHKVYSVFSEDFKLPKHNFILGSGCENTLKCVFEALNVKSLHYSFPCWGFIDVYKQQFKFKTYEHQFSRNFKDNEFDENIDVYYSTLPFNNFIPTMPNQKNILKSRYTIIDLTYMQVDDLKKEFYDFNVNDNVILVGSFDKQFGCGLRLGFAVFPNSCAEKIQLFRENFINSMAETFILKHMYFKKMQRNCYWQKIKNLGSVWQSQNYAVFQTNLVPTEFNFIKFDFYGKSYIRIGIPQNQMQFDSVLSFLIRSRSDEL